MSHGAEQGSGVEECEMVQRNQIPSDDSAYKDGKREVADAIWD